LNPTKQMLREEDRDRFNRWKRNRKKQAPANDHMNRERFTNKMERNNHFYELRAAGVFRGLTRYSEQENGRAVYYVAWSR
jgi:hypothetical protein